ncbi:MAG TPA: hypothetical protein VLO09_04790 [Ornithinimicrobium sp.]|nr:hypothetical protein [Ornithinimicrobium sp.]
MNTTSVEITAGMGGFLVLFGLMIAIWLLGRDLTRRLRRMRLREEERVQALRPQRPGTVADRSDAAPSSAGGTVSDREPDPLA